MDVEWRSPMADINIAERPIFIVAERSTLLKKQPLDSSLLGKDEYAEVERGKVYPVLAYKESERDHWWVRLGHDAGEWYVYDGADENSHWHLPWYEDLEEDDPALEPYKFLDKTAPVFVTPKSPFSARFTPNFTLGEWCKYQERRRPNTQAQCNAMLELSQYLETVRSHFGDRPLLLHSGHRPPAVNRAVGGASRSEHLGLTFFWQGKEAATMAGDFSVDRVPIREVQSFVDKTWPYSVGYGALRGFVHFGIRSGRPRRRWDY